MFNLEAAITEWRQQMLAAGVPAPVPLEELEIHLREEVEAQVKLGRSETEAFAAAAQNIGGAQGMRREFAKIGEPGTSREQKFMGMVLAGAAIVMPAFMAVSVWHSRADMTTGQLLCNLTALGTFAGLIWAGRLGYRRFPVIGSKRTRDVIGGVAAGVLALWWGVFLCVIVPHYDFTMMELLAAFIWAFFTPAGLMLGLVLGLDTAARKQAGFYRS